MHGLRVCANQGNTERAHTCTHARMHAPAGIPRFPAVSPKPCSPSRTCVIFFRGKTPPIQVRERRQYGKRQGCGCTPTKFGHTWANNGDVLTLLYEAINDDVLNSVFRCNTSWYTLLGRTASQ